MNSRIVTVVMAAGLLASSTGCSGMKNFLFGRGAACGLCSKLSLPKPCFGNMMPPAATCPPVVAAPVYAPAPAAPCVAAPAAPCVTAPVASYPATDTCGSCYAPPADCGCGTAAATTVDPYLMPTTSLPTTSLPTTSLPTTSYPSGGVVYDQPPIVSGSDIIGSGSIISPGTGIPADNFQSRRVDYDGAKILHEDPLPAGAVPIR